MTGAEPAFDAYAAQYDAGFTNTAVGRLLRNRVWFYLEKTTQVASHPKILEINCGTGEDALWFAQRGFDVTATDLSQGMIDAAEAKSQKQNQSIYFQCSSFENLHEKFPEASFDIIFSDFGGLNCVNEETLKKLSKDFFALLKPRGKFIAVVMSRDCWWERRYFLRKGKKEEAFRRQAPNGVEATIEAQTFTTWYYTTAEFASCFANEFTVSGKEPIGWMLPPSYLDPFFSRRKILLRFFNLCEKLFARSKHADKADHFFIVLERKA